MKAAESPVSAASRLAEWWRAIAVYRDRRVLSMLFLGFSSGFPFGVLADPLSAWLTEAGVSKAEIGLFALISLPYSLKFLVAPFLDRMPLPLLTSFLGRRRGWALATQMLLLAAVLGLGFSRPEAGLWAVAALAALTALASASQDIVIDAYRVEILEERKLAAGAATAVFGWRVGQMLSGAGGLLLADVLPWNVVFLIMATLVSVGMVAILVNPEPDAQITPESRALEAKAEAFLERRRHLPPRLAAALAWIYAACVCPLIEFVSRPAWLAILLFIMLYKFGDAVLGVMKMPFFIEIGFSKTEIAEVVKLFGFAATVFGGFVGGIVVARLGIMRGLLVCGVLMAVSNLMFVLLAQSGTHLGMLAITVSVENITTGMGMTAFVAYMSSLCNVAYTATQYALLTSLMAVSRTILSSGSGWLAEQYSWTTFFIITTLAALPGLLILIWLMRRFPQRAVSVRPATGLAE